MMPWFLDHHTYWARTCDLEIQMQTLSQILMTLAENHNFKLFPDAPEDLSDDVRAGT